ncbi:MAG: ankyrin repeat domain-containing protein [Synergistaceae bacterium]|nr:ankyrin repeat domain-containing protein [Synergistaceae bacterium]
MNQREFLYICARGSANDVEDAIKNGASPNRRAKYQGVSVHPIFVAVMEENFGAIGVLLEYKAKHFPAFMAAMIMEDKSMLKFLVNLGLDINAKDNHKRTPLLCAVTANKFTIVKWLIELGADVNIRVGFGVNVLTYAAIMSEETEMEPDARIIKILMSAKVDYTDAMMMAIKTNNLKFIELLLKNGADVNKIEAVQQSPLSLAILNIQNVGEKAVSMAKLLIKHGANVNEILDLSNEEDIEKGRAPIFTTNINLAISMESEKCLELLLKNGANPNFLDSKGRTPLMYAVLTSLKMVDMLLTHKADPNLGDLEGRTPLTLAIVDSEVDENIIKTLLEHGANPNIRDNSGYTALTWAVNDHDRIPGIFISALIRTGAMMSEKGHELFELAVLFNVLKREIQLDNIKNLISYGADPNIPDKRGVSALGWSIMNFDEEIAEILKKSSNPSGSSSHLP